MAENIGITVGKNSRYRLNTIHKDSEDRFYFSLPRPINIKSNKDDSYFGVEIKHKHRMDKVSNRFFNNSKLWWIIAIANDMDNGLFLDAGNTLRVPAIHGIYGHGGVLSDV